LNNPSAIRIRISGRVQGVGYRSWTVKQASKRGLDGWVRNRIDGTVEALLIGEEAIVRDMIEACRTGPMIARVDEILEEAAQGIAEKGFTQKPTV